MSRLASVASVHEHGTAVAVEHQTVVSGGTRARLVANALELPLVLAAYAALTTVLSWPLLQHLSDSILGPSRGDNFYSVWSLWWYCHAVSTGQDPAFSHAIFSLAPRSEVFVDGAIDTVASCPIQWFTTPLVAYNLLVLLSFVLGGFFMYVLARFFVRSPLACFAVGFLYSFSTFHFAHALGHMGLLTIEFLPFAAWTIFRFYRCPSWTNAALCGLGLASVPLSEAYYVPYFLLPFVLVFLAAIFVTDRPWLLNRLHLAQASFAGLLGVVITLPLLASSFFRVGAEVQYALQLQAAIINQTAVDPLEYILPYASNPLFGTYTQPLYSHMTSAAYGVEQGVFLGYMLLLFALLTPLLRRGSRRVTIFWWVLAALGLVLALGQNLTILGHYIGPLPFYRIAFGWGPLSSFRAPNRLVVLPLVALSVLAAMSLGAIFAWSRRRRLGPPLTAALCTALVLPSVATNTMTNVPIPSSPSGVPSIYRIIARDPSPGLVLDLPLTPTGDTPTRYLYYQTVHHHHLVFGYGPRVTNTELESVEGVPYLTQFVYYASPDIQQAARQQGDIFPVPSFRDVLVEYGIRYVVLHLDLANSGYASMQQRLRHYLGKPFYSSDAWGVIAWRLPNHLPQPKRMTEIRLGTGWMMAPQVRNGQLQHIVLQNGQLLIRTPRAERTRLDFLATAYFKPLALRISLNGKVVETAPLPQPWVTRAIHTPAIHLHRGLNVVVLHSVGGCTRLGADPRCYSIAIQRVRLHVS